MLIFDEHYSSVLTPEGLRTGRATRRDRPLVCMDATLTLEQGTIRTRSDKTCKLNRVRRMSPLQLLETTVSM